MKARFFKTLWGHTGAFAPAARQALQAGFAGLEGPVPVASEQRAELAETLAAHGLDLIAEISTTGYAVPAPGATVEQHLDAFERLIDNALPLQPLLFSTMAGSDLWEFRDSVRFLTRAWEIAQDRRIRIGFETHRSRSLFHPVVTRNLLAETPPIELTIDFSHWCNVCERLVMDELPDVLALCARRVLHIQPRIGYDQGAQVPDPRAPRFASAVEAHLRWWRALWRGQLERGFQEVTMTPEFGPDGYLQENPWTGEPVADLWELNTWTARLVAAELERLLTP